VVSSPNIPNSIKNFSLCGKWKQEFEGERRAQKKGYFGNITIA